MKAMPFSGRNRNAYKKTPQNIAAVFCIGEQSGRDERFPGIYGSAFTSGHYRASDSQAENL